MDRTGTRLFRTIRLDQMRDEKNGIAIRSSLPSQLEVEEEEKEKRESHTRIILIAKIKIIFITYHLYVIIIVTVVSFNSLLIIPLLLLLLLLILQRFDGTFVFSHFTYSDYSNYSVNHNYNHQQYNPDHNQRIQFFSLAINTILPIFSTSFPDYILVEQCVVERIINSIIHDEIYGRIDCGMIDGDFYDTESIIIYSCESVRLVESFTHNERKRTGILARTASSICMPCLLYSSGYLPNVESSHQKLEFFSVREARVTKI
jgi:hypothetical protein